MKKFIAAGIILIFFSTCLISVSSISIESSEKSTFLVNNNQGTLIIKVIGKLGTPLKEKAKVTAQFCDPDSLIPISNSFDLTYADPVPGCNCDGHYIKDFTGRVVMIFVSSEDYNTLGPYYFKIKDGCDVEKIRLTKNFSITKDTILNQYFSLLNHFIKVHLNENKIL